MKFEKKKNIFAIIYVVSMVKYSKISVCLTIISCHTLYFHWWAFDSCNNIMFVINAHNYKMLSINFDLKL